MNRTLRFLTPALAALALALAPAWLLAQDADIPLNDESYHFLDRMDIKGVTKTALPTDIKPYPRELAADWLGGVDTTLLRRRDKAQLHRTRLLLDDFYAAEEKRRSLWKYVYRNRRDLVHYQTKDNKTFRFYLNPMLYLSGGVDLSQYTLTGERETYPIFRNGRGASIRGSLFKIMGFYTEASDNQAQYPLYINRDYRTYGGALPGEANIKAYRDRGYDFGSVKGYITVSPIKQLRFKLGRDRNFFGNGYRSNLLSDNATDYWMASATLRIWKIEYQYMLTQMVDFIPNKPDLVGTYPRKYGVFHQFSYRPDRRVSISIFEGTMYGSSLPNGNRGFELEYLNPVIFYRTVEQIIGSPDNSVLGAQFKANVWRRFQFYGQFLLDDFNFGQRKNGDGWWGNKFAWQLGMKYIDVLGIESLDFQFEANQVRPYTYAHYNASTNYTNYNQFLAHDMGANVRDFNFILRYQPVPRLFIQALYTFAQKGADSPGLNYGGNPTLPDLTHNNGTANPNFNNFMLQGVPVTYHIFTGRASYHIMRLNAWVDADLNIRKENDLLGAYGSLTLRLNMAQKVMRQ